jgi:glutamyl-tRNA reductase
MRAKVCRIATFSRLAPRLRIPAAMSPVGRALHERFESICRSELQRLRRKTASLTEDERAQVDALALEVTARLAGRLDAALEAPGNPEIGRVVMRLFAVTAPH